MARRNFEKLNYGPFELRGRLRAELEPGERLVAWSPVTINPTSLSVISSIMIGLVPVLGPLLGAVVSVTMVSGWGLAVLTDRKLMVLGSTRSVVRMRQGGMRFSAPVESIAVRTRTVGGRGFGGTAVAGASGDDGRGTVFDIRREDAEGGFGPAPGEFDPAAARAASSPRRVRLALGGGRRRTQHRLAEALLLLAEIGGEAEAQPDA